MNARCRSGIAFLIAAALTRALWADDACPWTPTPAGAPTHPTLQELAQPKGLTMGAMAQAPQLMNTASDTRYGEVLAEQYGILTPENEMKWEAIHPSRDVFDFTQADAIVNFAKAHGMKVRGHCLLWNMRVPEWLKDPSFTPDELKAILHSHITTVIRHFEAEFPGVVTDWDVFNEAPVSGEGSFWERIGSPVEVGRQAFQWAHEACPNCRLFYNLIPYDLGRESDQNFQFVRRLQQAGAPITGVGLQFHLLGRVLEQATLANNMRRYAELGLEVDVTEMDVALKEPVDSCDLARQAEWYRRALGACLEVQNCRTFVTWGFTDRYTWIPMVMHGYGSPLPFNADYQPKPAYTAMREVLGR